MWEKRLCGDGGEAMRIFCYQCGVWAGLGGVRETCNGPERPRTPSLGGMHSSVAAGTGGSGLCLLEKVPRSGVFAWHEPPP